MKKTVNGRDYMALHAWGSEKLADLDFADDLALLCNTQEELQEYFGSYMSNYGDVTYDMCTRKSIISVSTSAPHMEVKHN